MSDDFYKNIKGFHRFSELTNPDHYAAVPADWYVVMTDIKGSTQAIAEGRYKEINLAGAAVIMAILNITAGIDIPYSFGGDGATLLIPPSLLQKTLETMAAASAKVREMFGMDLRAGCVPLKTLYEEGTFLQIAKFHLSPHVSEAVFQGTALALAESWLKKGGGTVLRSEDTSTGTPDLQGLECRWQPIKSRNGEMISLLVKVLPARAARAWDIYAGVLHDIETLYPEYPKACPTYAEGMHLSFSPAALSKETRLRGGSNIATRVLYFLKIFFINMIGQFCLKRKAAAGSFDGKTYLLELVANSDARKFDEMLRMVLDSTVKQSEALESSLKKRQEAGEIVYGIHRSSHALMTCLVFSLAGNHVHFIDGSDGGYALAARQMKQQSGAAA